MRFFPVLVFVAACAHPIGGPLEDARESRALPSDLQVTYREVGGQLGSREVTIDQAGQLILRHWRPGFVPAVERPEQLLRNAGETATDEDDAVRSVAEISVSEVLRLVDLLVEIEGWEEGSSDDLPADPVEGTRVSLRVAIGSESSQISEWGRDLEANDRLLKVRTLVEEWLAAAHSVD